MDSLFDVFAGSEPDTTREGVMVMDMGLHAIPTMVEPQQIIEVLIPGVEERARHLPPLTSSGRLMPGRPTIISHQALHGSHVLHRQRCCIFCTHSLYVCFVSNELCFFGIMWCWFIIHAILMTSTFSTTTNHNHPPPPRATLLFHLAVCIMLISELLQASALYCINVVTLAHIGKLVLHTPNCDPVYQL